MSSESAVSYAALILADADVEITSDKLLALTKAAGVQLDAAWANIFAKAVEGKNLKDILFSFAASGPSAPAAAGASSSAAAAEDAPAEEEKEEEKEESDDDMGFGLFD